MRLLKDKINNIPTYLKLNHFFVKLRSLLGRYQLVLNFIKSSFEILHLSFKTLKFCHRVNLSNPMLKQESLNLIEFKKYTLL